MTTQDQSRPSWQTEACPPWCVVDHREDDHPDDRVHDSASRHISALLHPSQRLAREGDGSEVSELLVVTSRRAGDEVDWTYIGEPDRSRQYLNLSRESARRLASALTRHLDALG